MKAQMRKEIQKLLERMTAEEITAKSQSACERLIPEREFRDAEAVMMYVPMRGEVDTSQLAIACWQQDKTVLIPKVDWEHRHMHVVTCRSLADEMVKSKYGVPTPVGGEPWPIQQIDLVIVPALAYDLHGHRVGHGGGFYDRFLDQPLLRARTCGLAFEEQVVEELPVHDHDQSIDMLVTDCRILRFGQ